MRILLIVIAWILNFLALDTLALEPDLYYSPTIEPSYEPTFFDSPVAGPTEEPTFSPSCEPSTMPSATRYPTGVPTQKSSKPSTPSKKPTMIPSSKLPSRKPTIRFSVAPTKLPSKRPSIIPTTKASCVDYYPYNDGYTCAQQAYWGKCNQPWLQSPICDYSCRRCISPIPTASPLTSQPTVVSTSIPTASPSFTTSLIPSSEPSIGPSQPTVESSSFPSALPSYIPTSEPSQGPTVVPPTIAVPSSAPTPIVCASKSNNLCLSAKDIVISSTLSTIASYAFSDMPNLISVLVPSTITSIQFAGFKGSKMSTINIPSGLLSIGDYAFYLCPNLNVVDMSTCSSLKVLGKQVFANSGIQSIILPASMNIISAYSFYFADALTSVKFSPSSGNIQVGALAFGGCSSLQTVACGSVSPQFDMTAFQDAGVDGCTIILTQSPSSSPTNILTSIPSEFPTVEPTWPITFVPSSLTPSMSPTILSSNTPTRLPSKAPSNHPTVVPTALPTMPSCAPTVPPSKTPSRSPTFSVSALPSSAAPSIIPTKAPSTVPSSAPSVTPSNVPSNRPTFLITALPSSNAPSIKPSSVPSKVPSRGPSMLLSIVPSESPTFPVSTVPSFPAPSVAPTATPSSSISTIIPSTATALTKLPTKMLSKYPTVKSTNLPTSKASCVDYYPFNDGYTCAQQAYWGKCNQPWLQSPICDFSCGRCISPIPTASPSTPHPTLVSVSIPTASPTFSTTAVPSSEASPTSPRPSYFSPISLSDSPSIQNQPYIPSPTTIIPTPSQPAVIDNIPSNAPTALKSVVPTSVLRFKPTQGPSIQPTVKPSKAPSHRLTKLPSRIPSRVPTRSPTSLRPSRNPSTKPVPLPTSTSKPAILTRSPTKPSTAVDTLCCATTSYANRWTYCPSGAGLVLPSCSTCATYQCIDWTVGSAGNQAREASFLSRTGQSVYFGVGSFGDDATRAGNCYRITAQGVDRDLIVQVVNKGADTPDANFDLQTGDGGFGLFDACSRDGTATAFQFDSRGAQWGNPYGGWRVSAAECSQLPQYPYCATNPQDNFQDLCRWSFGKNLRTNPTIIKSCQVQCPVEVYQMTGLRRSDEPTTSFTCGTNFFLSGGMVTTMMDCAKPSYGWADNIIGTTFPGYQQVVSCRRDGYTRINS